MARYNREFLVPYLQDVCALHLAYQKLSDKIYKLEHEDLRYLKNGKPNPKPKEPDERPLVSWGGLISIVLASSFIMFFIFAWIIEGPPPTEDALLFSFGLFVFALMIVIPFSGIKKRKEENEYRVVQYKQALKEYESIAEENEKLKQYIPAYEEELAYYKQERKRVKRLLNQVYDVNIIPGRYRDSYVAMYLYDWFGTSQADDLDMALNTLVLEEIKERLDTMINYQAQSILNQRMILANQQRAYNEQQRHNSLMRAEANRIAASNEERNIYLSMIESNTAATAYFAAAEYLK